MFGAFKDQLRKELDEIKEAGMYKEERIITSPQYSAITVKGKQVINFCANNYLGLCNSPEIVKFAKDGLDKYAYGLSSVRFICGTQDIHKELEATISKFLKKDDTILYSSCFDANGGLFETILKEDCVIITDALNHASIIDGIRLCKATRHIYKHLDMNDLEARLKETQNARVRLVATDGVFSMDGDIAPLDDICKLAEKYDALVMLDDAHATGFVGKTGRGSPEYRGVLDRVDIITSTLGKALGGASGGFTAARKEIVEYLRQRSRPYLFSNSLAPVIAYAENEVFKMLSKTTKLRDILEENTKYFREKMTAAGFKIRPGVHPIVPIMLGDAKLAQDMARDLLGLGIYVIGFFYPVVPKGEARIRVQLSAAHTKEQMNKAIDAFTQVGKKYHVI
ncbi:MAG: glycine C-acetyltransferase [Candidatus Coatesbacteria bacterium]|nr:glycine C-acetyltransferase [Candidatus Coatesbacteria bacterium]